MRSKRASQPAREAPPGKAREKKSESFAANLRIQPHTLVIDNANIFYQCHIVQPQRSVDLVVSRVLAWQREWGVGSVYVCLEGGEGWRDWLSPAYKGNRSGGPPEGYVAARSRWLGVALQLGWTLVHSEGYEADDTIASVVAQLPGPHTVVSSDKDMRALVGPGVRVWNPHSSVKAFVEHRASEWLAVKGDSIDCVRMAGRRLAVPENADVTQWLWDNPQSLDAINQYSTNLNLVRLRSDAPLALDVREPHTDPVHLLEAEGLATSAKSMARLQNIPKQALFA